MNEHGGNLKDILMDDDYGGAHAQPSVLHELNKSNRRLEKLLADLRNEQDAEGELRTIARSVTTAAELNPDIALACIFLNQIAGTYAVRHCIETAIVTALVARKLHRTQEELLVLTSAALTMNVGMLRHQNQFNKTSSLNSEEMAIVRRHPEDSANLLKSAGIDNEEWLSCVLMHHENDDGSGYPEGKTRDDITQNARLLSLADRYCAQVSARNYRCSVLPDKALERLLGDPDKVADPVLADHFIEQIGKYPPGSLVRMQSNEIGVVIRRVTGGELYIHCLRDAAGKPLRDANGAPLSVAALRRSSDPQCAIVETLSEDDADVRFSMRQIWGEQASL